MATWRSASKSKLAKVNAKIDEKRNPGKTTGTVPSRADYVVPPISKTGTEIALGAPTQPGAPSTNPGKIKVGTNPIAALRRSLGLGTAGGTGQAQPVDRSKVTRASVATSGYRAPSSASAAVANTTLGGAQADPAVIAAQEEEVLRRKKAVGSVQANIPKTILG